MRTLLRDCARAAGGHAAAYREVVMAVGRRACACGSARPNCAPGDRLVASARARRPHTHIFGGTRPCFRATAPCDAGSLLLRRRQGTQGPFSAYLSPLMTPSPFTTTAGADGVGRAPPRWPWAAHHRFCRCGASSTRALQRFRPPGLQARRTRPPLPCSRVVAMGPHTDMETHSIVAWYAWRLEDLGQNQTASRA